MAMLYSSKTSLRGLVFQFFSQGSAPALRLALTLTLGLALSSQSVSARAALNITPPQLAPDANGVVATEVKSTLNHGSRWSVRIIPWDPNPSEPDTTVNSATAVKTNLISSSSASQPQISPRFFSLQPMQHQVIRARIPDRSKRYRLLIEQVADQEARHEGVNFQFRFSLPVYQSRQDPAIPLGITIR